MAGTNHYLCNPMRDFVWTLIIIWLTWQVVNIFRRNAPGRQDQRSSTKTDRAQNRPLKQKPLDTEGEYVDFEEIR